MFVDYHSSLGASSGAIETLKEAGVPVSISRGAQLFHHKYILIDDRTLVCGSANWTKSAFNKNCDCFMVLHSLSSEQCKFMSSLGKIFETQSQPQQASE